MDAPKGSQKDRSKILAAVMAGVNAYLEEEASIALAKALPIRKQPPVAISLWHASGREEMMRMRTLWQRRIV
jgi:hypothetical protein